MKRDVLLLRILIGLLPTLAGCESDSGQADGGLTDAAVVSRPTELPLCFVPDGGTCPDPFWEILGIQTDRAGCQIRSFLFCSRSLDSTGIGCTRAPNGEVYRTNEAMCRPDGWSNCSWAAPIPRRAQFVSGSFFPDGGACSDAALWLDLGPPADADVADLAVAASDAGAPPDATPSAPPNDAAP